ncbi:MAG: hypothetical protein SAK29_10385 [Scytonema sp. PMC 1069.18]|nr:hypothetical protein [Scytonema sp. PMC 1069.18]MEC4882706.1 hypothetical protein [Scytonema sp. PMC 1070.18]
MLRLYHILLAAIVLMVLTPFGIKHVLSNLSLNQKTPSTTPTRIQSAQTTATNTQSEGNIWKNVLGKTAAPLGWTVDACEGNAPLLCVSSNGKVLGTVEMTVYPLEKEPNFQKILANSGIPVDAKVDYQNPKYQTELASALQLWVSDHYGALEKDRRDEYRDRTVFSPKPLQTVEVGKLKGMRYGFTGLKKQGGVHEDHLGYVAFDGKALYVITTSFDRASATGNFKQLENFSAFEPFLSPTVKSLNLPK